MPDYWEMKAADWEAFQRDMASMQEELFNLWCSEMEQDYAERS